MLIKLKVVNSNKYIPSKRGVYMKCLLEKLFKKEGGGAPIHREISKHYSIFLFYLLLLSDFKVVFK